MSRKLISLTLICIFLFSIFSGASSVKLEANDSNIEIKNGSASWTVMAYMNTYSDSDLEGAHIDNFLEMATVGSSDNLNIVVQLKRPGSNGETSYGDWSGIRRGIVLKDDDPTEEWGEKIDGDMGNHQTLSTFCNWAKNNYQADKYLLVLAGHGYGSRGCFGLTMSDLNSAFKDINNGVDIVTFESCSMGTVEVASAIAAYVDYMVASEKSLMTSCLIYGNNAGNGLLNLLENNPSLSTYDLTEKFITNNFFSGYTKSAIDLSKISFLKSKISDFSSDLVTSLNNNYNEINDAFVSTRTSSSFEEGHRDLYYFADLIDTNIQNINSAESLKNAIDDAVIDKENTPAYSDSYGLSIYMGNLYESYRNEIVPSFCADTSWDEFLEDYYTYENQPPETPDTPSGSTKIDKGKKCPYKVEPIKDPEADEIYYYFDFGDGSNSGWLGPYNSGEGDENEEISCWHTWDNKGSFEVRVKAKDDPNNDGDMSDGAESSWSDTLTVTVQGKGKNKPLDRFLFLKTIFSLISYKIFSILHLIN